MPHEEFIPTLDQKNAETVLIRNKIKEFVDATLASGAPAVEIFPLISRVIQSLRDEQFHTHLTERRVLSNLIAVIDIGPYLLFAGSGTVVAKK